MFKGKTVLVTGASSGIGEEFAIQLADLGANLILVARSEDKLVNLSSQLKSKYSAIQVTVITSDLTKDGSVDALVLKVKSLGLSVDYLINNAGFGKFCQFEKVDFETYQNMITLNITSLTELSYAFIPEMKARNSGGIINVASTGSFQPLPYQAVYGASKAYVLSFSEALFGELLDTNVQVMALCPGMTESNFMKNANADTTKMKFATSTEVVNNALKAFKKKRIYTVSGSSNYVMSLLPRLFSRKRIVKAVAGMFKDSILT